MMNVRSLRFRLAAWYFCTVTAIFALAAGGYWLAVRSALEQRAGSAPSLSGHRTGKVSGGGGRPRTAGDCIEARTDRPARRAVPGVRWGRELDCAVVQPGAPQHSRTAAARPWVRDSLRNGRTSRFPTAACVAEGDDCRPAAHRGCGRSAKQVRGRAQRIHVGPAAFNAHHPDARDLLRPVARASRPRTGRQDYRGCPCHHRAEPVRATGRARLERRAAATVRNAERDARPDRGVVFADQAIHGGCVSRTADAADVDLHGRSILAPSSAEPGRVAGQHAADPARVAADHGTDRRPVCGWPGATPARRLPRCCRWIPNRSCATWPNRRA